MAWTQLYCQISSVGRGEGESVLGIVWAAAGPLKPGTASCFITVLSNSLTTAGNGILSESVQVVAQGTHGCVCRLSVINLLMPVIFYFSRQLCEGSSPGAKQSCVD